MEREKRDHALVSGRRGEHVEMQKCFFAFWGSAAPICFPVIRTIWSCGSITHCGPVCCYGVWQALLLTAPCSWQTAPEKLGKEGWSCCTDQPLQGTAQPNRGLLHCVLGITAGICLGRERKACAWAGTEIKQEHSILRYISETVASFPLKTNQFHPKHRTHVLLKLRGKKAQAREAR